MKKKRYGELFYVARFQMNMTQTALAEHLGISQSAVSKLEVDRLEPNASDLIWLVGKLLNVNLVEHLEAALVPGRLRLEQQELSRQHREKKHAKQPNKSCQVCLGELDRQRREAEVIEARKREAIARAHGRIA